MGRADDKGNGGIGHVHRTILVEAFRSEVRGESTSHSSHHFHRENIHMSKAKPLNGEVDETTESGHSKDGRARRVLVPLDVEIAMAAHTAHDDCRNCFRVRMIRCNLNFHNAVEMGHCNGRDGVDLHNAVRLE